MADFFNEEFLQREVEERRALAANDETAALAIEFNLRKRVSKTSAGMASSYIDRDTSGTYNPRGERLTPPPPKTKRPRVERSSNNDDDDSPKTKRIPVGYGYPMSFVFTGEEGRAYLRSITPGPYKKSSSNNGDESSNSSSDDSPLPRRETKLLRTLGAAPLQRSDGGKFEDLTEGGPQRKGCKACFLRSDDCCSLIDDPLKFPCVACNDVHSECEYIVPIKLKMACTNCKRQKIQFSYTMNGGKGVARCDDCGDDDLTSIAALLDEYSSYGGRFATIKTPPLPVTYERMYAACQQCRNSEPKVRCSLRSKAENGPCSRCKASNKECTFLEIDPEAREQLEKGAQDKRADEKAKRKAAKEATKQASKVKGKAKAQIKESSLKKAARMVNKAQVNKEGAKRKNYQLPLSPHLSTSTDGIHHKIILTPFAHPIKFNHEVPEDGTDPCRFCDSPYFGIWGDGPRQVEIIPYGGRKGNVEVSGGHFAEQGNSTKMCPDCTYYRVRITTCRSHKVVPLQHADPRSYSQKAIQDSLNALNAGNPNGEGNLAMNTKWCSICTSVAEFQCNAPHRYSAKSGSHAKNPIDVLANTVDQDFLGCGLYLCGVCNQTLRAIESSRSSTDKRKIIDVLYKIRKDQMYLHEGDAMRADSEFLLTGGLMLSFLNSDLGSMKQAANGEAKVKPKENPRRLLFGKTIDRAQKEPKEMSIQEPIEKPIEPKEMPTDTQTDTQMDTPIDTSMDTQMDVQLDK